MQKKSNTHFVGSTSLLIFLALTLGGCGLLKQSETTVSSGAKSGGSDMTRIDPQKCTLTTCPINTTFNQDTCHCDIQPAGSLKFIERCGPPVSRGQCADGSKGVLADVPKQSEPYCDEIGAELNKACTLLNQICIERKAQYCPDGKPLNAIGGFVCLPEPTGKVTERCPISSHDFKKSIHYVNENEARQISNGILNLKIANYNYNEKTDLSGEPGLGFIIEDYPSLPYARSQSKSVDQYSYISAAVLTIQTQQAEIESLRKRLDQLEKKLEAQTKK